MKIKKLIRNARKFLDSDERDRKEKKKHLKHVLRKLSNHKKKLTARLASASAEADRAAIEKRLQLLDAQRKKGLGLLAELKETTDS